MGFNGSLQARRVPGNPLVRPFAAGNPSSPRSLVTPQAAAGHNKTKSLRSTGLVRCRPGLPLSNAGRQAKPYTPIRSLHLAAREICSSISSVDLTLM